LQDCRKERRKDLHPFLPAILQSDDSAILQM
jgi:hypothetical protein